MVSKVTYSAISAAEIQEDILGRKRKCQLCGRNLEIDKKKRIIDKGFKNGYHKLFLSTFLSKLCLKPM
jgi:hypothetical protein